MKALQGAEVSRPIYLTKGQITWVDAADLEWLSKFSWKAKNSKSCSKFYACFNKWNPETRKYKQIWMHRLILDAPAGMQVDHIDGNSLNNRRSNLRLATHSQNQWNRAKYKCNSSGYKGVYPARGSSTWIAMIKVNRQPIRLGNFKTKEQAAQAYQEAAKKYHGEFAHD